MEGLRSIAIAGAWGYIGQRLFAAARALGLEISVFDPGPPPPGVDLHGIRRFDDERAFYDAPADVFHLALHPHHRGLALASLFARCAAASSDPAAGRAPLILCEKPMAEPERPQRCAELIAAAAASGALLLFNFPELFDPLARRIEAFLSGFAEVEIDSIYVQRSKDREDPANPRNRKLIVPIEYQESVHCLASVLDVLAQARGSVAEALAGGVSVSAESLPYQPPNPADYKYVVDGWCAYRLCVGATQIEGLTDFKRGAPWAKRRVIRGRGDGRPFLIEADHLEGNKRLVIDGCSQDDVTANDSYVEILRTLARWQAEIPRARLMSGVYPNPPFAAVTYQLSSALWRSSRDRQPLEFDSFADLMAFDARFAEELPQMDRYAGPRA